MSSSAQQRIFRRSSYQLEPSSPGRTNAPQPRRGIRVPPRVLCMLAPVVLVAFLFLRNSGVIHTWAPSSPRLQPPHETSDAAAPTTIQAQVQAVGWPGSATSNDTEVAAASAGCSCATEAAAAAAATGLPGSFTYVPLPELLSRYNTSVPGSRFYSISTWRHTKPPEAQRMVYQPGAGLKGEMCFFVRAEQHGLMLGTGRWMLVGGLLPDNATDMAASGEAGRLKLVSMMQEAHDLGLNTLRLVAFKDGHTLEHAMQVAPGIMDERTMAEGLDWIVWQARRYGLRLVLVLTSGRQHLNAERGGMAQYVRWHNPQGVANDFYRDDTYKAHYFDYMTGLAVRENVFTKLQLRHDPTVLGWDVGDGLMDPGHNRGDELQGWIPYISNFIRRMDPNHLVFLGGEGFFGSSSPHLLHLNPNQQARLPWLVESSSGLPSALPYLASSPACEGVDFLRNNMPREVDMSAVSIAPDEWLSCDDECKMTWSREWLAAHVRDALRMQKPLLVTLPALHGPPSRQRALQHMVVEYLARASKQGMPIAGLFIPLPSFTWCGAAGASHVQGWNVSCLPHEAAQAATQQANQQDTQPAVPLAELVGPAKAAAGAAVPQLPAAAALGVATGSGSPGSPAAVSSPNSGSSSSGSSSSSVGSDSGSGIGGGGGSGGSDSSSSNSSSDNRGGGFKEMLLSRLLSRGGGRRLRSTLGVASRTLLDDATPQSDRVSTLGAQPVPAAGSHSAAAVRKRRLKRVPPLAAQPAAAADQPAAAASRPADQPAHVGGLSAAATGQPAGAAVSGSSGAGASGPAAATGEQPLQPARTGWSAAVRAWFQGLTGRPHEHDGVGEDTAAGAAAGAVVAPVAAAAAVPVPVAAAAVPVPTASAVAAQQQPPPAGAATQPIPPSQAVVASTVSKDAVPQSPLPSSQQVTGQPQQQQEASTPSTTSHTTAQQQHQQNVTAPARLCGCFFSKANGSHFLTAAAAATSGWSDAQLAAAATLQRHAWQDAAWRHFMRGDDLLSCLKAQAGALLQKEVGSVVGAGGNEKGNSAVMGQAAVTTASPMLPFGQSVDVEAGSTRADIKQLLAALPQV